MDEHPHLRLLEAHHSPPQAPAATSPRIAEALRNPIAALDSSPASVNRLAAAGVILAEKMRSAKSAQAMRAWLEEHLAAIKVAGEGPYAGMNDLREAVLGVAEEASVPANAEQALINRALFCLKPTATARPASSREVLGGAFTSRPSAQPSPARNTILLGLTFSAVSAVVGNFIGGPAGAAVGGALGYLLQAVSADTPGAEERPRYSMDEAAPIRMTPVDGLFALGAPRV